MKAKKAREVRDQEMFVAIQKYLRAEKKARETGGRAAHLKKEGEASAKEASDQIYNFFKRWIAIKLEHDRRIPLVVISEKKQFKVDLNLCEDCKGSGQDLSGFMRAIRRDNICPYCYLGSGIASITITYNGQVMKRPLPNSGLFIKGV